MERKRTPGMQIQPPADFRFLDLFLLALLSVLWLNGRSCTRRTEPECSTRPMELLWNGALKDAIAGQEYAQDMIVAGGDPPYACELRGLPEGLRQEGCGLRGRGTRSGLFQIDVVITDQKHRALRQSAALLVIDGQSANGSVRITTRELPTATAKSRYAVTLAAEGGTTPYQWAISDLPEGLSLDGSHLAGVPLHEATVPLTVRLIDARGTPDEKRLSLRIENARSGKAPILEPLRINTVLPAAIEGSAYELQLSAVGGIPPYRWKLYGLWREIEWTESGTVRIKNPELLRDDPTLTYLVTDSVGATSQSEGLLKIVRPSGAIAGTMAAVAALGSWVILCLLLRRAVLNNLSSKGQNAISTVLCLSLLLVGVGVAINSVIATIAFTVIMVLLAAYVWRRT